MLRAPAVAGQFYPGRPQELAGMIQGFVQPQAQAIPALLAVSPHAGYIYSGAVAGKVLSQITIPRRVVVLGPNHRGQGSPVALMGQGAWETPLGRVELDSKLTQDLLGRNRLAQDDPTAHLFEHSLEVQVPFLQYLRPDILLTPLCLGGLGFADCAALGHDLAEAIKAAGEAVLMVASTDMTHYESADQAESKDRLAIERMLALDPEGLYNTVLGRGISMCGVIPTTVALAASLALGASDCKLVAYTNSGDTTGDYRQVVGYAGLIVR